LEKAMLKFRATDDLEAYISEIGCLILKQNSSIHGHEVSIVLTPDQAKEIKMVVNDFHEEMENLWAGGMEEKYAPQA
jgi:hypothetical protein